MLTLFLLLLFSFAYCVNYTHDAYTGIRFTVREGQIAGNHMLNFDSVAKRLENSTDWDNLIFSFGSGLYSFSFVVSNIKVVKSTYDFAYQVTTKYEVQKNRTAYFYQTGPILNITASFDYDFKLLGMHWFFGNGTIKWVSNSFTMFETYHSQDISTILKLLGTSKVEITGLDFFLLVTRWIKNLFNDQFIVQFSEKFAALFRLDFLKDIEGILYQTIQFGPENNLRMNLTNSILTLVEAPRGYFSMGLRTNYTVENMPIATRTWKYVNTPINARSETFKICVSNSLIPTILELQRRTGIFSYTVNTTKLGLSGTLKDLAPIMPKLYDGWDPTLKWSLTCKVPEDLSINSNVTKGNNSRRSEMNEDSKAKGSEDSTASKRYFTPHIQ